MGRLVVAASGGAMQFTINVSLFRLLTKTVVDVVAERDEFEALGIVIYELLPHMNKLDEHFLDKVQHYSERIGNDVLGLEDGAALIHQEAGFSRCVDGSSDFATGVGRRSRRRDRGACSPRRLMLRRCSITAEHFRLLLSG